MIYYKRVNINGVNYYTFNRIENDNNIEKIITDIKGFDEKNNERVFFMTRIISHEIDSEPSDFEECTYILSQDDNDLIKSKSELFDDHVRNDMLGDFFKKLLTAINLFLK